MDLILINVVIIILLVCTRLILVDFREFMIYVILMLDFGLLLRCGYLLGGCLICSWEFGGLLLRFGSNCRRRICFGLFVGCFLDFFCCVYQFDHFRMTYSFSWLKLNQRKCFKTHIRYHKGMLTIETSIFIWNYRICHRAAGASW